MVRVSGKIRRLIVDAGLVTDEAWNKARDGGGNIIEGLISSNALDETALLEALGRAAGIPPVELSRVTPDPSAVQCLPQETCLEYGILPLTKNGDILTIAVADPFDVLLLDDLRRRAGCQIRQIVSHPVSIKRAQEKVYQTGAQQVESLLGEVAGAGDLEVKVDKEAADLEIGAASGEDAPAVKLINLVLLRALKEKASDIHLEPGDKTLRVRYRVDGNLSHVMQPPKSMLNALISRLKIMAQLDIAERFAPQDGKFQIRYEGRTIDFRLSILPVVGGEKAVMRILDGGSLALKLESMGYETRALEDIRKAINAAYGMMLVTGPTGSGKSTTLYSCVQEVATADINVVTVEDPVEYRMDGINQVPVNPKRGLTFAGALRSILRQDPDVILVGEIRDTETADIAIKAALTGHLVLSTLHTNDAASTITRLMDMGVDPFMVSSSLLCVGAQRLSRKLCEACRQPLEVPPKELLNLGYLEREIVDIKLFRPNPQGCGRCNGGYRGRFALLETLYLDDTLKRMVVERRSALDIKAEALKQGMVTLRRCGLMNAMRGRTSLEEVLRVTLED
ncbi:MAG: GspE/PulE family protein [Planctomycetota bacterium]